MDYSRNHIAHKRPMSRAGKALIALGLLGAVSLVALVTGGCSIDVCPYVTARGQPAWSPDGRRIAFRKGIDIYVINVDGTGLRRVIRGSCDGSVFPSWSPDSRRLAVQDIDGPRGDIEPEWSGKNQAKIAVFDVRTGRRTLVSYGGFEPAWSPDGRWIAFVTHGLHVVQPDGSQDGFEVTGMSAASPAWSPNGKQIVFAGDKGLYVVPVTGGNPRKILDHGESPAWSPDGRRIAFSNSGEIGLIRPDGSLLPVAYECGECDIEDPAWSPDGRQLVFYQEGVGIRIVTVGGQRLRTLAKV